MVDLPVPGIFRGSSILVIGRGEKDTKGGILLSVTAGDVIVIPAGTTHCCLESKDGYRYIGIYPEVGTTVDPFSVFSSFYLPAWDLLTRRWQQAPKWRNMFGKTPVDHGVREEILGVEMPVQDPVYGADGPMMVVWGEASREAFGDDVIQSRL